MAKTISKPNTEDTSIAAQIQKTLNTNANLSSDDIVTIEYTDDEETNTSSNGSTTYIADPGSDIQTTFGDLELTTTQVKTIAANALRSQKLAESPITEDIITDNSTNDITETSGYAKLLASISRWLR